MHKRKWIILNGLMWITVLTLSNSLSLNTLTLTRKSTLMLITWNLWKSTAVKHTCKKITSNLWNIITVNPYNYLYFGLFILCFKNKRYWKVVSRNNKTPTITISNLNEAVSPWRHDRLWVLKKPSPKAGVFYFPPIHQNPNPYPSSDQQRLPGSSSVFLITYTKNALSWGGKNETFCILIRITIYKPLTLK